jgi:hypothetical protein
MICKKNPCIASPEDVDGVQRLELSNCQIDMIDDLDLFYHITELNLSQNKIHKIENLEIFHNLKLLDLSFNRIDSLGLKSSIGAIPKNLQIIVLTGNPCATDEEALALLQDKYPKLAIAIEEGDEELPNRNENEEKDLNKEDEEEAEEKVPISIDTEEVLKYIVDRKCKMQNIRTTFDLDSTVKVSSSYFIFISL